MRYRTAIDDYVTELSGLLTVGGRARRRIVDELRAHLDEATEDRVAGGMVPRLAAEAAVRDCGPARAIAADFAEAHASRRGRVAALLTMLAGVAMWFTGSELSNAWIAAPGWDFEYHARTMWFFDVQMLAVDLALVLALVTAVRFARRRDVLDEHRRRGAARGAFAFAGLAAIMLISELLLIGTWGQPVGDFVGSGAFRLGTATLVAMVVLLTAAALRARGVARRAERLRADGDATVAERALSARATPRLLAALTRHPWITCFGVAVLYGCWIAAQSAWFVLSLSAPVDSATVYVMGYSFALRFVLVMGAFVVAGGFLGMRPPLLRRARA